MLGALPHRIMSIEGVDRIWKIGAVMHVAASKVAFVAL
jgi:hypothetical protein